MKTKIIIIDTNIITDMDTAGLLDIFISLDNIYISDMVKHDEMNDKTGDLGTIRKIKTVSSSFEQVVEMNELSRINKKLSSCDLINFVIARDNDYILATGDKRLKNYAMDNGVEVIGTIKIIDYLLNNDIINNDEYTRAINRLINSDKVRLPKDELEKRLNGVLI